MKNSPTNRNEVVFFMSYPRTGGTLLSKILRNHDQLLLVSEVHPKYNSLMPLSYQVENWYGIPSTNDYELDIANFIDYTLSRNKKPVIRDFCHFDFEQITSPKNIKPANLSILEKLDVDVKKVALVRNSFDVWLSQKTPENFGERYLSYIKTIQEEGFKIIKYEDLCSNPKRVCKDLFDYLDLSFSIHQLAKLSDKEGVTGDISEDYNSRGFGIDEVVNLKRRPIPLSKLLTAINNKYLKEANKTLGYDPSVFSQDFENKRIRIR